MATFKEKLGAVLAAVKSPRVFLHNYKVQGREPFLLYICGVLGLLSLIVLVVSTSLLVSNIKKLNQAHHREPAVAEKHGNASASDKNEGEHAKEESHGDSEGSHGAGVLQSPFPKEILEKADGIPEPDHDLSDQVKSKFEQLKEGLKQKDLEIKKPNYFVLIDNITASAKEGRDSAGGIYANITLDLDSPAAEQEALAQITEFRSIITAIISEKQRATFMDYQLGIPDLKTDIQKRLQPMIKSGKIQDVLFEKFFFK